MVIERVCLVRRDVSVRIETMPPENQSKFFRRSRVDDSPRQWNRFLFLTHPVYRNSDRDIREDADHFVGFSFVVGNLQVLRFVN